MATNPAPHKFVCVGDGGNDSNDNHRFSQYPIGLLKNNAESGCPLCGLIYMGLRSYYGELIQDHDPRLKFSLFRSYSMTMRAHLWSPGSDPDYKTLAFTYMPEKWETETSIVDQPIPKKLGGIYSQLKILPGRPVPDFPESNISLVMDCIQNCVGNHEQCQTVVKPTLPTRVVDVGTSEEPVVKLYESHAEAVDYATLSHSWGQSRLLTTTQSTLDQRKKAIIWSDMSRTFQNAIKISRRLGLRYLWIDSLCIIQNDAVDWQIESSKMAAIYENSYITIAANNAEGALIGDARKRRSRCSRTRIEPSGESPFDILVRGGISHETFFKGSLEGVGVGVGVESGRERNPLFQRAWCFQERLLATRLLHFTDEEMVFECKTHCECECGGTLHERPTKPLKKLYAEILRRKFINLPTESPWEGWAMIVSPYIRKDITKSNDILPALAGLASRMQCDELGQYVAGLWEHELPWSLFWFADVISTHSTTIQTAPTFSWAVLAGTSQVRDLQWVYKSSVMQPKQRFKNLDIRCQPAGSNPYSVVSTSTSFIKLHGLILQVTLKHDMIGPYNSLLRSKNCEKLVRAFLDSIPITNLAVETDFLCLLGFTWVDKSRLALHGVSSLLLKPLGNERYQRVGCLPYLQNDAEWFGDAEEKTFFHYLNSLRKRRMIRKILDVSDVRRD